MEAAFKEALPEGAKAVLQELGKTQLSNGQTLEEAWPLLSKTIFGTVATLTIAHYTNQILFNSSEPVFRSVLNTIVKYGTKLPVISKIYNQEIDNVTKEVKTFYPFQLKDDQDSAEIVRNYLTKMNHQAVSKDQILEEMGAIDKSYNKDLDSKDTKVGNLQVYYFDQGLLKLQEETYKKFMKTNMLHLDTYMSVRKFDAEVCRIVLSLYQGNEKTAALHTSGGTESIFLAMLAYRSRFYSRGKSSSKTPEILMTVTAHPAFNRAAHYFRMKIVYVKTDKDQRMDLKDLKSKVSRNSVCVVVSCPNYPHGVYDPVEEISKLNIGVPLHLDCCLGGFLTPFAHDAGFTNVPKCDFSVKGVATISADTHKYGCSPKGSSLVLFESEELRSHAIFSSATWAGGIYMSQTLSGSKSGASVAITWATMRYIGYQGYVENARGILALTQKIYRFIKEDARCRDLGLKVFPAELSTIALHSDKFSIFKLLEIMNEKGWTMHACQNPAAIHIAFTNFHTRDSEGFYQKFTTDVVESLVFLTAQGDSAPENETIKALYGMSGTLKDTDVVENVIKEVFNAYYSTTK